MVSGVNAWHGSRNTLKTAVCLATEAMWVAYALHMGGPKFEASPLQLKGQQLGGLETHFVLDNREKCYQSEYTK